MKNPYQLGREARDRNCAPEFNPYIKPWEGKMRYLWDDGWFDRDEEIFLGLGCEVEEYERAKRKVLK